MSFISPRRRRCYSLQNPHAYVGANLVAFVNLLEACRHGGVEHLTMRLQAPFMAQATHHAVLGARQCRPSAEPLRGDKESNELLAHSYSHLYRLPTAGLASSRSTALGAGPDMAMFIFAKAILEGKPIPVFNHGRMQRDFTYIDDIVEGVIRTSDTTAAADPDWSGETPDPATSRAPYRLYNIGNNKPEQLMRVIELLEQELGRKAQMQMLDMQPGDVPAWRYRSTGRRRRFSAEDVDRGRDPPLRRVVSKLPRALRMPCSTLEDRPR